MDLFGNLALGFHVALAAQNLAFAALGCVLGTLIGVLPGIGPVATIAMLLPAIVGLDATPALVMLAGIYYGAQCGGSTAAILVHRSGESLSATAFDGYQMARQGRAGPALSAAALGSLFAGVVGTALIAAFAPPLTELAFRFGPAEYFSLVVLGLVGAVVLASGSLLKGMAMVVLGLLLAQVDTDSNSGVARYGFDLPELADGIGFAVIGIGLFAVGEVIANLAHPAEHRELSTTAWRDLWPTRRDVVEAWPSVVRGTALGSALGVLPGGGALLASFASYSIEKRVTRSPRIPFGKGAMQGVAGPESATNAAAQTSFMPMLALGIPPNAAMALMVGAMTVKGIQPGPQLMTGNPQLFWGLIASMWVGNLVLVLLNLPLVGLWTRLLAVPYRLLYPAIVLLCCIGVYTLNGRRFDVAMTAVFGFVGYVFYKLRCEGAPLLLGYVLEPTMEESLRRALQLSGGNWSTLVVRPLSGGLLAAAALVVLLVTLPSIRQKREVAFIEE